MITINETYEFAKRFKMAHFMKMHSCFERKKSYTKKCPLVYKSRPCTESIPYEERNYPKAVILYVGIASEFIVFSDSISIEFHSLTAVGYIYKHLFINSVLVHQVPEVANLG